MPSLNQQFEILGLRIEEENSLKKDEGNLHSPVEISAKYIREYEADKKKKISITIDPDLYSRLKEKANKEKRSMSSIITYCAGLGLKSLNETRIF